MPCSLAPAEKNGPFDGSTHGFSWTLLEILGVLSCLLKLTY